MSRDVIWQPGHVSEESIMATADGLGDGRETSGHGDRVIADKLMPFDLIDNYELINRNERIKCECQNYPGLESHHASKACHNGLKCCWGVLCAILPV